MAVRAVLLVRLSCLAVPLQAVSSSTSPTLLPLQPQEVGTQLFDAALHSSCSYQSLHPRQYVAYQTAELSPDSLDGDLTKSVWAEVPWTEDFVDIETPIKPPLRTRAKMRWDSKFLYVGGELEEHQIWANQTEDDTVIFHDNDFEIFVDPGATTHFYKEFEMNALNKNWTLCLNKPYGDGGYENSSRVFQEHGWNMGAISAVQTTPTGVINNASRAAKRWTVEVALPLAALMYNSTDSTPGHGSFWRIGFSRVEWQVEVSPEGKYMKRASCQSCRTPGADSEDNWVWSRQGEVAMHLPERWGILQFSTEPVNTTPVAVYEQWASRSAAMAVYYAEHAFAKAHNGSFTANLTELSHYSQPPFQVCQSGTATVELHRDEEGKPSFTAHVLPPEGRQWVATVTNERYLTAAKSSA